MTQLLKQSQQDLKKSTQEMTRIIDLVLAKAKVKGASDAVVSLNHDLGFSVDVRMREVETVAFNEDRGLSLTVYLGQQKGSASTSDLSEDAITAMVQAAIDIAEVSAADPCFGLPDARLLSRQHPDLDLYHDWDISPQSAIELAKNCEQVALSYDSRISNSDGVNVSTYSSLSGFANTQGAFGIVHSSRHSLSCSLIASDAGSMQRDYDYSVVRNAKDLMSYELLAQSAASRTISRLNARTLKTGKMPVLFSSRISSGLISSLINAISGNNLYRKNSFLLDSIGQVILPPYINIHEQPHLKGALGSAAYDAEGVTTRHNMIVESGILKQYVLGSYSARKLGLETTANSGGVFNLTVDPTAGDLDELLSMLDTGFFITELMGQGVNILTGDYSRGASGFWVEKGHIQYPVEGVTIAGNLAEMYQNILAVGSDRNLNSATRCGSILISEMMIAGE